MAVKGSRKKSSFYHTRIKIVPNKELAAEVLGCTVSEVEKFDLEGAPVMAERLLCLWDRKYVGVPGWDGWLFSRGVLMFRKQQFSPDNLLQLRKDSNKVFLLEIELRNLHSLSGLLSISKHLISITAKRFFFEIRSKNIIG